MANPNKKIAKALPLARQLALRTLLSMQARNEKLQAALNITLSAAPAAAGREGKALCTNLVYGCIRLKLQLDWILDQFFARPGDVPGAMRRVMRMAVYEIFHLSHIPVYATISTYVAAIKAGYGAAMAGLANAVLRRISQSPACDKAWLERRVANKRELAEIWYSMPGWLLVHFRANYPAERAALYLDASLKYPPLGIRANPLADAYPQVCDALVQADGIIERTGNAFAYAAGQGPDLGVMLAAGEISRQSYEAQTTMRAIFTEAGGVISQALQLGPIWDVCAGQGGKTCWLLEQGLPVSVASDTNLTRLKHLLHEVNRLKLPRPTVFAANATSPLPVKEAPGIILIDAPCSGLGTLSRRPDIKLYRRPDDLPKLAALQQTILVAQYSCLPVGGLLIYLTCTLNPEENEQVIDRFVQNNPGASVILDWESSPENPAHEFFWGAVVRKDMS